MWTYLNGEFIPKEEVRVSPFDRGFLFGDSVFETIRTLNNKVLFLEDHYFRLMASMRICRMEIPMQFTMEYFESQILNLIQLVFHKLFLHLPFYLHHMVITTNYEYMMKMHIVMVYYYDDKLIVFL